MINATEARLRSNITKEKLFDSELNNIQNKIKKLYQKENVIAIIMAKCI